MDSATQSMSCFSYLGFGLEWTRPPNLCLASLTLDSGFNGLGHTALSEDILHHQNTFPLQATVRPPKSPGLVQGKVAFGQQGQTLLVVQLPKTGHGPVEVVLGDLQVLTSL